MSRVPPSELFERLFEAATSRFRKRGYEQVSISDITREVSVAKGTFFNYFPTKEHLLAEVFHRFTDDALQDVQLRGYTGTDAILGFCGALSDLFSRDRAIAVAVGTRLSSLPAAPGSENGLVRGEERIRSWVEARLAEALPVSVPLVEADSRTIAFLVLWALRGSLDEWIRSDAGEGALRSSACGRVEFLLRSVGLAVTTPEEVMLK